MKRVNLQVFKMQDLRSFRNEVQRLFPVYWEETRPSIISVMITLMIEAAGTTEMSVNFYQTTRRNLTEDSRHLFIRC
jgi:hypothetical protein